MPRRGRAVGAVIAALAGGAAAVLFLLWSQPAWVFDRLASRYPGCLYRVETEAPLVALTVDDGPDPEATPLILAELKRHGARATFFLISGRIAGQEQLIRDLARAGHEVGNHLTRDQPSIDLSPDDFEADLLAAHGTLTEFGVAPWARPGSGWYSRTMIEAMRRHGYRCALGSVYPYDALLAWPAVASRLILRNTRPGAIIILHDGDRRGARTARVLRWVLPELQRRGFRVVTLSELVRAG